MINPLKKPDILCLHILKSIKTNKKSVFVLRIAILHIVINTVIHTILEYILQVHTRKGADLVNADIWTSRTDNEDVILSVGESYF